MLSALPADVAEYLSFLATLRARACFEFRVGHQRGAANPVDFVLQGHLAEGRVDDPRLPFPLSDLEADVFCDNRQLRIENVTAQSGPTTLELSCRCDGFLSGSPQLALTAQLDQLPLDDRLYKLLPESLQAEWNKFAPQGTVDVVAALSLDDNRVEPDIDINCRDVSFSYHKFPMRLQQGHGVIHYAGNRIQVREFTAMANGQTISLAARVPGSGTPGHRLADRAFRRTDSAGRGADRGDASDGAADHALAAPERRDHGGPGARRKASAG